ncbi:PAB1-binding protein 1 [Podospora fimiseda]|uniref:PAB1-binding protein 1 n=1 Tax=Podospora fimiseda TaxID=252190 RepID=A0AAN7BRK7_9PEZI|nr:PAB1-binding protein 1 [Podospora fimiseda]
MEDRSIAAKPAISTTASSTTPNVRSPPASGARPLYSNISKLSNNSREKEASASNQQQSSRQPPVQHRAWSSGKNPVTGRTHQPQQNSNTSNNNSVTAVINTLREIVAHIPLNPFLPWAQEAHRYFLPQGQRVIITHLNKSEFEGTYASADHSSLRLNQVLQKKLPHAVDLANGAVKQQAPMTFQRKDIADIRVVPGNASNKNDGKIANGNKSKLQTDSMISGGRFGVERELQAWNGGSGPSIDMSLEKSSASSRGWDQFKANENLFGLKTDYDENIYTTTINRDAPDYQQKAAIADRKAREIERSAAVTQHVAEERVMDFTGGGDDNEDEEDKYSGVRRQNPAPLGNRENKYTPPARRAPTAQPTVKGAPFDPAIIDSRIVGAPASKQSTTPKPEEPKAQPAAGKPAEKVATPAVTPAPPTAAESTKEPKPAQAKAPEPKSTAADAKPAENDSSAVRSSAESSRAAPLSRPTDQVEQRVLQQFKNFAGQQRHQVDKMRATKLKQDKEVRLTELKKFANTFKLSTPIPADLVPIIAKDKQKQDLIQQKALQNAQEVARQKEEAAAAKAAQQKTKPTAAPAAAPAAAAAAAPTPEAQPKPATEQPASTPATTAPDTRAASRPTAPQHSSSGNIPTRHTGPRGYNNGQGHYGRFNQNNRMSGPHMQGGQTQPTGHLSQRLRNHEQQKMQHLAQHGPQDMRLPPTGPANNADPSFSRRISGVPGPYLNPHPPKLNPNSHEFRPSAFAPAFNPAPLPSQGSSPRSSVNNIIEIPVVPPAPIPAKGQLIRRKTKAIDVKKCLILSSVLSIKPPAGRNWDDNDGLRPAYDTPPTWKQIIEDAEPQDSIFHLTYNEYFERLPRTGSMPTPNPSHAMPQMPPHAIPFHLQQHGGQAMAPRQSPLMPSMQMQGSQHGHVPHGPYNNPDDHRMMHSNSAQSFASPRMGQMPIAYPPGVNAQQQIPYGQPVMQGYMGAGGAPPMAQYRSFSNNGHGQFIPQQPHHMGGPMMVQPQFMGNPNGMVPGVPPMYPGGGHPQQFIPPGPVPPQPMVGSNGYPNSPGRPAAPMMAHQGSHQGSHQQPVVYGMSPAMPYQQPAFTPQQQQGKFTGQRPQ